MKLRTTSINANGRVRFTVWAEDDAGERLPFSDEVGNLESATVRERLIRQLQRDLGVTEERARASVHQLYLTIAHAADAVQAGGGKPTEGERGPNVPLAELLDTLDKFLGDYVVMTTQQREAVVLWIAFTYVYRAFDTAAYVSVRSPEKRSGKSRLLEVLDQLVDRPIRTENISVAALAHSLAEGATLLLDEVDTIFKAKAPSDTQEMLRGVLDAGYRCGGAYIRMVGQGAAMKPQRFDCFGPKALAGIGRLPGTLDDRSVIVVLRRRRRDESITAFRFSAARERAAPIRESLTRWSVSAQAGLRDALPVVPQELHDRAQDSWEPLLAIAELAGGSWPERGRKAALALAADVDVEDDTVGVQLLAALQAIFGEEKGLATQNILETLNSQDESPWPGFNKGRGLTPRSLAGLLKPFGARPDSIRFGNDTYKGYKASALQDAWDRYVPVKPEIIRNTGTLGTTQIRMPIRNTDTAPTSDVPDLTQAQARYDVPDVPEKTAGNGGGDTPGPCQCPQPEHFAEGEPTPGRCPTCGNNLRCRACGGCIPCGRSQ
jgi:hypothetical protein